MRFKSPKIDQAMPSTIELNVGNGNLNKLIYHGALNCIKRYCINLNFCAFVK